MTLPPASPFDLAAALRALADRVDALDAAQVAGELETLRFRVWASATTPNGGGMPSPPDPSGALDVDAAAARMGMSPDWVYREARAGRLPFARHHGRRVVFDEAGLARYLARRR